METMGEMQLMKSEKAVVTPAKKRRYSQGANAAIHAWSATYSASDVSASAPPAMPRAERVGNDAEEAAAVGGLEFASNWLGEWFLAGQYGLPKDPSRAAYWFAKVVDGAAHSLDGAACPRVRGHRERAAERLSLLSAICTPAGPEEALPECIKG